MNRKVSFPGMLLVFLASAFGDSPGQSQQLFKTTFFPEPAAAPLVEEEPGQPTIFGKVLIQDSMGNWVPRKAIGRVLSPFPPGRSFTVGNDVYIQDGSETAIGTNYNDGNNLFAAYNILRHGVQEPVTPISHSADGNLSWAASLYPDSLLLIGGPPFDPWVNAGNAGGEFFGTFCRYSPTFFDSTHVHVHRSTDNGTNFSLFYQQPGQGFQDKEALDIDKTMARGGGAGNVHDGKLYLGYDEYQSIANQIYQGSFLQVISPAGAADTKIQISGTGSPVPFRGNLLQPASGIEDGTFYVKSNTFSGSTQTARFHEITNGGAGPNTFLKSTFTYSRPGQRLYGSGRWGVNGHRIDIFGYLDIDRSSGPRQGYLYYISNRNPNPSNTALDQGDIYLSVSTNGAASWSSAVIPAASAKTQYMPMMDVDEQGWIHVAYYQNETGSVNNGVLNASTANIHYTVSTDGGSSWSPPVQVNDPANALDYEDPPPDRVAVSYYLIGDYDQLAATGTGAATKAYVLWAGYDKDRSDTLFGDMRARVYCTTVQSFPQCQNDVEAPVVICQPDTVLYAAAGQCSTVVNFWFTAQDNCPLGVAVACDPPSGSTFPVGTDTVVCIATDLAANADTCSFAVTVTAVRGDMNASGDLTPADVVLHLNCIFLGSGDCGLCVSDANCSGDLTPADVVLELILVFTGTPLPC